MKFKELLEKMEGNEEIGASLRVDTISSVSSRRKVFIAWVSDFLANKVWLDKEVVRIYHEQVDDYTSRMNVLLQEPEKEDR